MDIVNGYACRDCSDVALATRNVDPAKGVEGTREAERRARAEREAAVKPADPGANAPLSDGPRGRVVNLAA